MKLFSKLGIASAALVLICTTAAQAQSLRVTVPFNFHAGSQLLPAGDYQLKVNLVNRDITITSLDGAKACYVKYMAPYTPKSSAKAKLVFNRYGEASFLQRVEPGPLAGGFELFTSRAERDMAKLYTGDQAIVEGTN